MLNEGLLNMTKDNTNKKIMIEILKQITTNINDLKADFNRQFYETNQRIDELVQRLDRIDQNTHFIAEEISKLKMDIHGQVVHEKTEPILQKLEVIEQMQDENCLNPVQMNNSSEHLAELWKNVLTQVEQQISKPSFETWLKSTNLLSYNESSVTAIVSAPNSFARDWLANHYAHLITTILTKLTGQDLVIQFVVQKNQDIDDFDLLVPMHTKE